MKSNFIKDINVARQFYDDTNRIINKENIDLDFYAENFEKILFYITKSFLSDNFYELFSKLDDEVSTTVFNMKCDLNKNIKKHSNINKYLFDHQYCNIPKNLLNNPMLAYKKIIRNGLCHYKYKLNKDIVSIDYTYRKNNKYIPIHSEISIASLIILLRDTLSSRGYTNREGAYDYYELLKNGYLDGCLFKIQNLSDNPYPLNFIIVRIDELLKSNNVQINSKKTFYDFLKMTVGGIGKYYIKQINFDKNIMHAAGINSITTKNDLNLYMCALDETKRAGIAYNALIDLVFDLKNKNIIDIYKKYEYILPVLSNTVFISYMSLVFDDYFSNDFDGIINTKLFERGINIDEKIIPHKLRNSLAHSRYHFENIFDSSAKIIIEFWDEDSSGKLNFQCKISKENSIKLIDDYLDQISRSAE